MSGNPQTTEVIAWLNEAAIELPSPDEFPCPSDFNALPRGISGARIVAFADPTHGTREFYQSRHQYLQLLVERLGFRALAIEGSYAAASMINDYVVKGAGDVDTAVQNLGVVMWNVREFIDALEWLRDWNRGAATEAKVQVFGLDIWRTAESRRVVLEYLSAVDPSWWARAVKLFEQVASAEGRGFLNAGAAVTEEMYLEIHALLSWFEQNEAELVEETSLYRCQEAIQHVRVILRWLAANLTHLATVQVCADLPRVAGFNAFARSRYMAENLLFLMEQRVPGAKVIVWAHMFHLGPGISDPRFGTVANMGALLRDRWGSSYYVFGYECHGGAYLARELLPGNVLGTLKRVPIPQPPAGSLPWYLGQVSAAHFVVELRDRDCSGPVDSWLNTSRLAHGMGWLCTEPPHLYQQMRVQGFYDALIFFRLTHPTTPTASAVRSLQDGSAH